MIELFLGFLLFFLFGGLVLSLLTLVFKLIILPFQIAFWLVKGVLGLAISVILLVVLLPVLGFILPALLIWVALPVAIISIIVSLLKGASVE